MAGFTLVSNQTIIARNAGALYGVEVGNANMTSYVSQVGSNVDGFLNTVYTNSVGTTSTSDVADVLITNLGITGDSTDPTSAAAQAKAYIVSQLNAVAYTARGAVVNSILSAFSNLTTDPTFGSFATAWNNKVANAVTYAAVSGTGDSAWGSVQTGNQFTLTTGVDILTGTAGNDTFQATSLTLTGLDSLNGGAGTDTLVVNDSAKAMATTVPAVTLTSIENINVSSAGTVGANAVAATPAVAAVKQINTYTPTVAVADKANAFVVSYGGVSLTTAATDGSATVAEVNVLVRDAINAIAGSTVANIVGSQIVVTAPQAGTALPTTTITTTAGTGGAATNITWASANPQVNVAGAAAVDAVTAAVYDFSGFADTTAVSITSVGGDNVKAGATQNVTVVNTGAGTVTIDGGLAQTVTTSGAVTLTGAKGAVNVTEASQTTAAISVTGGTDVTIAASKVSTGTISVGSSTAPATGAVRISQSVTGAAADASTNKSVTGGAVTVNGGTTVTVDQSVVVANPTSTKVYAGTSTLGATTVTGTVATTAVTVNQPAAVTAKDYAAAVAESDFAVSVKFKALAATETTTIEGLTFTAATGGATATQVAAAFANLAKGASAGVSAYGTFTGALETGVGDDFTSGAANGDTVIFTSKNAASTSDFVSTAGAVDPTVTQVSSATAAVKATGNGGVANGAVTVNDYYSANTTTKVGSIATVTANNFTTLTIDGNAVSTVHAKGGQGNITIDNTSGLLSASQTTTLALNLDAQRGGTLDDADIYQTLNVNVASDSYLAGITTTAVTAVTVAGSGAFGVNTVGTLDALKTITVTGDASLSAYDATGYNADGTHSYVAAALDLTGTAALTSVSAAGSAGSVNVKVLGTQTAVTGGAGSDEVTVAAVSGATGISKGISTGAGDDTVTLNAGTLSISNNIGGGDGHDTLAMDIASVIAVSDATTGLTSAVFKSYVTGFETLALTDGALASSDSADLSKLGFTTDVAVQADMSLASSVVLTLDKFASAGKIAISADQTGTIELTNSTAWAATAANTAASYAGNSVTVDLAGEWVDTYAADGTYTSTSAADAGVTAALKTANVGTYNVVSSDTGASVDGEVAANELTVTDSKLYAVNISGNADLALTLGTNTGPKTINASELTGALTVTAAVVTGGTTVTGGSGDDALTASAGGSDTLIGGTGNDTLTTTSGAAATLTGGAGNDTFVITAASAAKTIMSTITDFGAGDVLQLADFGTSTFTKTAVSLSSLAAGATLSDAINLAATNSSDAQIKWFQFDGNTYIVNMEGANTTAGFEDGVDQIVKLSGLVDLSGAGFNTADVTLHL